MLRTLSDLGSEDLRPLTEEEAKLFVMLCLQPYSAKYVIKGRNLLAYAEEQVNEFTVQVIAKRLKAMTPELDYYFPTILACAFYSQSVGDCVLWAHCLAVETQRQNKVIDHEAFADLFPSGIPTEEGRRKIWEEQKRRGKQPDNWLDTKTPYILPYTLPA